MDVLVDRTRQSIENLVASALDFLKQAEERGKRARGVFLVGENGEYGVRIKQAFENSPEFKAQKYSIKVLSQIDYDTIKDGNNRQESAWYSINLDWAGECLRADSQCQRSCPRIPKQIGLVYD